MYINFKIRQGLHLTMLVNFWFVKINFKRVLNDR